MQKQKKIKWQQQSWYLQNGARLHGLLFGSRRITLFFACIFHVEIDLVFSVRPKVCNTILNIVLNDLHLWRKKNHIQIK